MTKKRWKDSCNMHSVYIETVWLKVGGGSIMDRSKWKIEIQMANYSVEPR